jgi:hypothetical protein
VHSTKCKDFYGLADFPKLSDFSSSEDAATQGSLTKTRARPDILVEAENIFLPTVRPKLTQSWPKIVSNGDPNG